jgi:hypothetical protein
MIFEVVGSFTSGIKLEGHIRWNVFQHCLHFA